MSTHVNEPRYRKGWKTRDGKVKQGFWYVYHDRKRVNLTSKYGAPTTNKTKRDRSAALDARSRFMSKLGQATTRANLITTTQDTTVTVRDVVELYKEDVWPTCSEDWRKVSGWFFRLFCEGHTGEVYRNNPRKIEPYVGWGDRPAESITHKDLRDWLSHHDWGNSAVNAFTALKAAYNHAVDQKKISVNPIASFKTQRNHAEIAWFTGDEEEQYRKAAESRNPAFALFWEACIATGARPSELAKAQACHVRKTDKGRYLIRLTEWKNAKKKKHPRIIHLPNGWQEWIAKRLTECEPDTYLFQTDTGKQWRKTNWVSWNLKIKEAAGIEKKLTLYSCRHTVATRLLFKGATSRQVADWLGTGEPQINNTYGHLLEMGDEMGDLFEKLVV